MGSGNSLKSSHVNYSGDMPETITFKEAAAWLGVSRSTVVRYIDEEGFPKPIQFSKRRCVFMKSDCLAWFDERRNR